MTCLYTIEYSFTRGGICVKLDAVTFELFIYGCDTYFSKTNDQTLDYKKPLQQIKMAILCNTRTTLVAKKLKLIPLMPTLLNVVY